jgi:hypothetical protein
METTKTQKKWHFNFNLLNASDQHDCVLMYNNLFDEKVIEHDLSSKFLNVMEIIAMAIHGLIEAVEMAPNEYEFIISPEIEVSEGFIQTITSKDVLISLQQHLVIAHPSPIPMKNNFLLEHKLIKRHFIWEILKDYDFFIE